MHILIVEDERGLQKTLSDALENEGFEVSSALDGESALQLLTKKRPDLILLDLVLPKKDGFEVLKELKSKEEIKDIPVIVLTNLEGSTDIERALSLGATNYLIKANYQLPEIVEKIKSFIKE